MIRPEYLQTLFIPKEPGETQPTPDWSRPFAILTAFNPGGQLATEEQNKEQNRLLRQKLSRGKYTKHKVDAVSRDWTHTEKSFAVWGLSHSAATALGLEFGQDAYFWVQDGTVHVHSCHTSESRQVGSWEALLRTRGDKPTRHLYVIQLDPQVYQDSRAFREKNPDYRAQQLCLYVGTTVLSPEERFSQHQAGTKANRYAKKYGLKLLPDLYQNHPRLTANNYAEREESYANELRLQGHAVWQN